MARSPFQGTYQDGIKPTILQAPDAKVKLNGEFSILSCSGCGKRFNLNRYITNITTSLDIDSVPGSASFTLTVPRHIVEDFYSNGDPIILPMMEVEIYGKGAFLVEGLPRYYPMFWGVVTEISDSYSGGFHTFNVSCNDILKWWELSFMNTNPAYTQPQGQFGRDYIKGSLFNANVYDVIWTLAQQAMGDVIQAVGSQRDVFRENLNPAMFERAYQGIVRYWTERFAKMRSSLVLYGLQGAAVRGDDLWETQSSNAAGTASKWASQSVRRANGSRSSGSPLYFDPDVVSPYKKNIDEVGEVNFYQTTYESKLAIANTCKDAVGFEFFMDVTGDIVFKPPFYNMDVLSNKPVSWIQDVDVISWEFSESESEVITHLQVQGTFEGGAMDYGTTDEVTLPVTQVIDYNLLRKYGWRTETLNADFARDPQALFYIGLDHLDRINSRRFRGTVNIPFRPELRLGFPVYIVSKDQTWYVKGISHSITFGGRAETTLTLTAKRGKYIAPKGIGTMAYRSGSYSLKIGDAAQLPISPSDDIKADDPYAPLIMIHPKTGRMVGFPNAVLAYTVPYTAENLSKELGQKTGNDRGTAAKLRDVNPTAREQNLRVMMDALGPTEEKALAAKHLTNRYLYGMTSAGTYTYVHDLSGVIQEMTQVDASKISVSIEGKTADPAKVLGANAFIRPVSDERGFELIGHYRFGRGVSLRDGSLIATDKGVDRATVDVQMALSGNLQTMLLAQSSGLTARSAAAVNPAEELANLKPEDLQTAGFVNQTTGSVEFKSGPPNYIGTSDMNSAAVTGVATVEVSQLSNALTLAEMTPHNTENVPSVSCVCMMGRADLTFVNVGYQLDGISPVAEDLSDLSAADRISTAEAEVSSAEAARLGAEIDKLKGEMALLKEDPLYTFDPDALDNQVSQLQKKIDELSKRQAQELAPKPISGSGVFVPSRQDVISKVEQYMANLAKTMDDLHTTVERQLRGEMMPSYDKSVVNGTTQGDTFGALKPPFSPMGRALGGDPAAIALQGSSAIEGMATAWQNFGDSLRNNAKAENLRSEVARMSEHLASLDAEIARLEKVQESGGRINGSDVDATLSKTRAERDKTLIDLGNLQAKLSQLSEAGT